MREAARCGGQQGRQVGGGHCGRAVPRRLEPCLVELAAPCERVRRPAARRTHYT